MTKEFDSLKSPDVIKTRLIDVNFDFEVSEKNPLGPHIHYARQAASRMDEAFLFKSQGKKLSEEEQTILKSLEDPDTQINSQEDDDTMSEEIQKQLDDALAVIAKMKADQKSDSIEKGLEGLPFEDELKTEVVGVLASLEDEQIITINKALVVMKDFTPEVKKEELVEETDLQKELQAEAGADGEAEIVEKSLLDKINDARKELN